MDNWAAQAMAYVRRYLPNILAKHGKTGVQDALHELAEHYPHGAAPAAEQQAPSTGSKKRRSRKASEHTEPDPS